MGQEENWDAYLWPSDDGPGATMLRNKYGLHNRAALAQREYDATSKRELQLVIGQAQLPQTRDTAYLKAVHQHLFQDVYEWAGEYRNVNMKKGGRPFLDFGHLDEWLEQSFVQMRATRWGSLDHEQFADAAATSFAMINHAHPFREGNGRSSRIVLQQCTSGGRFELDFAVIARQSERWNEASRLSAPRHYGGLPDPDPLRGIFREIVVAADPHEVARLAAQGRQPGWSLALNPTPAMRAELAETDTTRDRPGVAHPGGLAAASAGQHRETPPAAVSTPPTARQLIQATMAPEVAAQRPPTPATGDERSPDPTPVAAAAPTAAVSTPPTATQLIHATMAPEDTEHTTSHEWAPDGTPVPGPEHELENTLEP